MINNDKRKLLYYFSFFPLFLNTTVLFSKDEYNYLLKGPLAGGLYYTKNKPGRWKNLKASHVPIIEQKSNYLEVTTPHEMKGFEHYIIKHIILDKKFNIVSEKKFDPAKDRAYSEHNIAGYNDHLYVMSICNLHDTWLELVEIF